MERREADVPVVPHDHALRSGDSLVRLKAHALGAVVAAVPADVAAIVSLSRRCAVSEAIVLRAARSTLTAEAAWELWTGEGAELDPFRPLEDANAGVLTLAEVREAAPPAYLDRLAAAAVGDAAALYLRASGVVIAVVALLRGADRRPFTPGDVTALRRMQPLLEHAFTGMSQPADAAATDALRRRGLTPREIDVAALVGKGATNAQIARCLHLSEATVKTHLTHVYAKVGVSTRTELAIYVRGANARRSGRFHRPSVQPATTFG